MEILINIACPSHILIFLFILKIFLEDLTKMYLIQWYSQISKQLKINLVEYTWVNLFFFNYFCKQALKFQVRVESNWTHEFQVDIIEFE